MKKSHASPQTLSIGTATAVDRLIESRPFDYRPKTSGLFLSAMREAVSHHIKACPVFKGICKSENFSSDSIRSERDIKRMPFIFVSAFKERDLSSAPRNKIVLELTSSGTTGQKSRILLDKTSLLRVRRIAWQVFEALGMADLSGVTDYICFTYDPDVAKDVGTAWTDRLLTGFTKTGELFYAFKWDKTRGEFSFDLAGAVDALERFEKRGRKTRILGFPAFALKVCDEFKERHGRPARLNPQSRVITGGGWKTMQDKALDKKTMRKVLADSLGIKVSHVRDLFGMVEHGVPYVDCALGNFHIPNYARIIARDPASLEPLGFGKPGLLQFITPYLTSYPSISLLTSDFGWVEEKCPCGLDGPIMHIIGRAGVKKLKGCAVSAGTLLKD